MNITKRVLNILSKLDFDLLNSQACELGCITCIQFTLKNKYTFTLKREINPTFFSEKITKIYSIEIYNKDTIYAHNNLPELEEVFNKAIVHAENIVNIVESTISPIDQMEKDLNESVCNESVCADDDDDWGDN
jgi:hypothetical protein